MTTVILVSENQSVTNIDVVKKFEIYNETYEGFLNLTNLTRKPVK